MQNNVYQNSRTQDDAFALRQRAEEQSWFVKEQDDSRNRWVDRPWSPKRRLHFVIFYTIAMPAFEF
jgi:hypothetical protein